MEYTFTGQASYMDDPITSETTEGFGLMFFNARWLDPQLGRFAQADSIVPGGVQGLDRYAYVNNNPLRYTDPTGHRNCEEDGYNCPGDKITHRPTYNNPDYSDWFSGNYSGCTLCHYAHAQGKPILTNSELATANQNFREWFAVGNTPIVATAAIMSGPALGPSVYNLAGVTCLSSPVCVTLTGAAGGAGASGTPARLSRVIQAKHVPVAESLAKPGDEYAFVTAAEDIASINTSRELSHRLFTLNQETGKLIEGPFAVLEFNTPSSGLASPVFWSYLGFSPGGYTLGGAREYLLPNIMLTELQNLVIRIVP
jgi:RHS repeat-associated protein